MFAHRGGCNAEAVVLPGHLGREHSRCARTPKGNWVLGKRKTVGAHCGHCGAKDDGLDVSRIGSSHILALEQVKGRVVIKCPGVWI